CSYRALPARASPDPGGKPAPSGPTLMSQPAICSGVAGTPSFGPSCACAAAPAANVNAATARIKLRIDVRDFPAAGDRPALDGVVVITELRPARGHERRASG